MGEVGEAGGVIGVEAGEVGAVEVEHTEHTGVADERENDFGLRGGVAGDVAGELVNVGDDDGLAALGGGAADATPESDADAGDFALKGAENEFAAAQEIKAGPVQTGKRLEKQSGKVRGVGEAIEFAGNDGGELLI